MGKKLKGSRADFDGAWKQTLDRYLDPFLWKALKWEITRRMYERGYSKQDVLELFRLIDWLLHLPEEQRIKFRQELIEY
jgi:hypothetical protein